MRLIDADALKKDLKSVTLSNGTLINTNTMIALINKYPTAYDIDKVVEELESLTDEECTLHECGIRSERCRPCIAKKAIEIVKHSCVSDDCCEWKQSESFMAIRTYNIGCCDRTLDLTVRMSEEMNYCPYCGKKKKVVE